MDDTSPEIARKMREMFQARSPIERLKMGFSMLGTSKYLIAQTISADSAADARKKLFLKFYGDDFDSITKQKILDYFDKTQQSAIAIKKNVNFEHIPQLEREQEWWRRLYPLIQARLLRRNPENSKLLNVLQKMEGFRTWKDIKNLIEMAIHNVEQGGSILARTSEIKNSRNPDGIIDDMFAELRTIHYLLIKGFTNINYHRRDNLDFKAEFAGNIFYIESTYIHGPDFKTQEYIFSADEGNSIRPIYKIKPDNLIRLFQSIYSKKKKQILRHNGIAQNSLICMVTDIEETHEPWLEHAKIQGVHPIRKLLLEWEIPVVILGCGSIYQPDHSSLKGIFGKLNPFKG